MILSGKEVFYIYKNFSYTLRTPLGERKHLPHTRFYKFVDILMQITMITNIIIRLLRYKLDYHIPNYSDNITYYLVTTCGIWSLLYFMQLIPYVGYIAIVLILMLKDTFIFTMYIAVFTLPYSVLFRRIRKFPSASVTHNGTALHRAGTAIFF